MFSLLDGPEAMIAAKLAVFQSWWKVFRNGSIEYASDFTIWM
jgi:hypothetical protein